MLRNERLRIREHLPPPARIKHWKEVDLAPLHRRWIILKRSMHFAVVVIGSIPPLLQLAKACFTLQMPLREREIKKNWTYRMCHCIYIYKGVRRGLKPIRTTAKKSLGLFQAITSYHIIHCKTLAW